MKPIVFCALLFSFGLAAAVLGQTPAPATQPATATSPSTAPSAASAKLPHIVINAEKRYVDVEATVATRDAKWLELLACTPGTREYEAILTVEARPSHIHLALLLLGAEPGSPLKFKMEGDNPKVTPPSGPKVDVFIVTQENGKEIKTPANKWVNDQETKTPLPDNTWLFAGSSFGELDGQKIYYADFNGSVISLVNFGDDILTRDTTVTNHSGHLSWTTNSAVIPPVGTKVILRLQLQPK